MGQGLDDGLLLVKEDDVPVAETFDDEVSVTTFGREGQAQKAVKGHLFGRDEARVAQLLPEQHGERRRRHGHGSVSGGGRNPPTSDDDEVEGVRVLRVEPEHDLLVVWHVGFLDPRTKMSLKLMGDGTQIERAHRLLHDDPARRRMASFLTLMPMERGPSGRMPVTVLLPHRAVLCVGQQVRLSLIHI